jgi:Sap, sulfolipid-1-addressing protein
VGNVVLLSFTAAANPTLIAVSTLMLLLPDPKRLMFGYLCGALMTSISLGLLIVFALDGSSTSKTTQHTLSPIADLVLGAIALGLAFVLGTGRDRRVADLRNRRRSEKKDKKPPRWQQALSKGSPRTTFLIGAVLTLPGASYLVGLHEIHKLDYGTAVTVLIVLGFNVVMLLLLELPLIGFLVAPDWTPKAIDRAKVSVSRNWHRFAFYGLLGVGAALVLKGIIGLIS